MAEEMCSIENADDGRLLEVVARLPDARTTPDSLAQREACGRRGCAITNKLMRQFLLDAPGAREEAGLVVAPDCGLRLAAAIK